MMAVMIACLEVEISNASIITLSFLIKKIYGLFVNSD